MKNTLKILAAALAATVLAACGGGGGGVAGGPVQPQASGATGVVTAASASSITVNGVAFSTSSAAVRIDDNPSASDQLKAGVRVKLRGTDDGTNGRATEIEVENEVRGPVQSISTTSTPQSFVVGGITVFVDAGTIYANLSPNNLLGVFVDTFVEVHGLRDASGNLQATRVEGKGLRVPGVREVDELRGSISNPTAGAFDLGSVRVTYNSATTVFTPANRCAASDMLTAGLLVEVHGAFNANSTGFAATRIDCEDAEDDRLRPGNGEKNEIEGFVTDASIDLAAKTGSFKLSGQAVTFGAGVQFRGGSIEDLIDGAKVEVEGSMNGTLLVAREIKFKRVRVILATTVEAKGSDTIRLFGKDVQINLLTEVDARNAGGRNSTSLADILVNEYVEMRGYVDNGTLVAERVKEESGGGSRDAIVQARVVAENETAFTLGLLDAGAPISAALAGTREFENAAGAPISRAEFFAAVTTANQGTLVKVKGNWAGGVLTAREAELED